MFLTPMAGNPDTNLNKQVIKLDGFKRNYHLILNDGSMAGLAQKTTLMRDNNGYIISSKPFKTFAITSGRVAQLVRAQDS